jgi:O-antigen/teichoic acid export membrane protein
MLRTIVRNIVSNWCGFAVQAVVAFFLTPFVLRSLGETQYGIWALATGLTGYYGLLDLGFRSGITQYLTRHLALREYDRMNRVASTAVAALIACGALCILIAATICLLAPRIMQIPPGAIAETRWCILIIGVSSGISFAFFPFSAVFAATQRYDAANAITIGIRLLTAAAMVISLRSGYGLIGLSVLNAISELFGYVLRMAIAYRILPQLKISLRMAAWENLWSITSYGIWSFLCQSAVQLRTYSSIFVIGYLLPIAAVTPFNLANQVAVYFDMIFAPMAIVFFPAATRLDAEGDRSGIRTMYLTGTRMLFTMAIATAIIAFVWADDFFRLWVGEKIASGGGFASVTVLFRLLLVTAVVAASQKIGYQVFLACRILSIFAYLLVGEAIVNLILCLALTPFYGLVGAAVAILIPTLVFQGILQPLVLCRVLKISTTRYLSQIYVRPLAVLISEAASLKILHDAMPSAENWNMLVLHGLFAGGISLLILLFVGLDHGERRQYLLDPMRRLMLRFGWGTPQDNSAE